MAENRECPFCGGKYQDTLVACPYCGTLNYKGAEAQYLGKLENVRTDMAQLGNIPEQETKKELQKQTKFVFIILATMMGIAILIGLICFFVNRVGKRDLVADYLWQQQNFPILTEAYENRDYEQLITMYWDATQNDYPMYEWEHCDFVRVMDDMQYCMQCIEELEQGQELSDYDYEALVYYGFKMDGPYLKQYLTEEEQELLQPYVEVVLKDFHMRWKFTEKEKARIEDDRDNNYGYPEWDYVSEYIKRWKKENQK